MVKRRLVIVFFVVFWLGFVFFALLQKPHFFSNPSFFLLPPAFSPSPLYFSPSPSPSTFLVPRLTLENIFAPDHSWINFLPEKEVLTFLTTGDVIPARTVNFKMNQYHNFKYPFEKTADFLKKADLTLINLEAPLLKNCPLTTQGMVFCGDPRFIEGLKFADIDVANLANNHFLNWGNEGAQQTISLLEKNNILAVGYPSFQLKTKTIKSTKIGFLGWNFLEKFKEEEVLQTIAGAKKEVDILVVSCHWGQEYVSQPAVWQKNLAHKIIEAGADLLVGHHPHWIQPLEIYQNKLIIYSHGNFIFDQEWSQKTKTGIVVKTSFYNNKLVDVQLFPVFISDFSQPQLLEGEKKKQILEYLKIISQNNSSGLD